MKTITSILFSALLATTVCNAADVTISLEGTCSYSGTPQAIAVNAPVTVTLTLNGDATDSSTGASQANFNSFSKFVVDVQATGYAGGSFNGASSATLDLAAQAVGTTLSGFSQDDTGGLPGLTDGQYGALVFIDLEVGADLSGDTGGSVTLADILMSSWSSPSVSGTVTIEPEWDRRVTVSVSRMTVANDGGGGTTVVLPAALSEAVELENDWYYLNWYGVFYYVSANGQWTYTGDLAWVYVDATATKDSAWLWSAYLQGWVWACDGNSRWLYDSNSQDWLFVYSNNPEWGCWLYHESTGSWEKVTF